MTFFLSKTRASKIRVVIPWVVITFLCEVGEVHAHASNQAFVPLLPTDFYIGAGVAAVALTVLLLISPFLGRVLSATPAISIAKIFEINFQPLTSTCSFLLLAFLTFVGFTGSTDPLVNPLPLYIWTVFWIGLISLHAILGNLWHWINPWSGPYSILRRLTKWDPPFQLPGQAHYLIAIAGFLTFTLFMLASLSPEDPASLAYVVTGYWIFNLTAMFAFGGDKWLLNCECFTLLTHNFSRMSILGIADGKLKIGIPGWKLKEKTVASLSAGLFVVIVFASSSFDGLNETFWWLAFLGINPLEFPGRSGVYWQTISGLLSFNIAMIISFSICVYLGLNFVKKVDEFRNAFHKLAVCIIPIAVAYHIAHFLTTFIVNIQYSLAAATDPWADGSDYLGLGTFYVTTGFFNTLEDVRVIFLTQVIVIVAGHLFSIVSAHNAAMELFQSHRKAVISQLPLAAFMVAYTFFGLWLLAAPRGA